MNLISVDENMVEIIDFKTEKKPDFESDKQLLARYRRQMEVYAHLVEENEHKTVRKMHLYYTGEDETDSIVTFDKSDEESVSKAIYEFDEEIELIEKKDFARKTNNKKACKNCDMRYCCGK